MSEEDFAADENPQRWKVVGEHKYTEPDGGVRAVVRIIGPAKIEVSTKHYHYAIDEDLTIAEWIANSLNAAVVSANEITKELGL